MGGDGDTPPNFCDILNDEKVEDVVEAELEEPEFFQALNLVKAKRFGEEEYFVKADCLDEDEYSISVFEDEVEPYFEFVPEPVATVLAMWDEDLDPLPMTSSPLPQTPHTSAADGSCSPSILTPSDVVVTAPLDDDIAMEGDHVFYLASEHQLFQQVEEVVEVAAEQPQQQRSPRRGSTAQRGRGRGRRARADVPSDNSQWVIGERMVEVNVNDDDVSEDLREQIMSIVRLREAARVRGANRARRVREENEEERIDEDDDEVESFFAAEGTSNIFEWSSMCDYQGKREQFLPQQTGAVVASENAYGAFRQYWDDDIMSHIVTETNRYAAGLAGSSAIFAQNWYDTNIHELLVLFSFWMMLGIIRMPTIKSCFTVNPLLQTNIFRKMFSRNRYENLCRAFHLTDNSSRPTDSTNLLFSLGPIVDHLNARFKETYIPSQDICIDESLTLWKGNLSFRQYIKTKAARFGVKTFELCESSTGYLWSFFVYLGAGTYDSGLPSNVLKSIPCVLRLIRPLLDKGYTLFMDNWFNSPLLAKYLKTRKTDCVGTLRANRSNVPPIIGLCNLKNGQFVARHSGDVVVLAFQDKKRKIATISTYHGNSQNQMPVKPHRPPQYRPQIVLDYNKCMGGVDRKDQMLEPYLLERKRGAKWNIKFFKRLLNCSILNARILLQSSSAAPKEHLVFRLELVDQILRHHLEHVPKSNPTYPVSSSLGHLQPRLQHFPRHSDQFTSDGHRSRRRCLWCSQHKRRQRTTYVCSVCEVPLCIDPCFELYHKK